MYGTTLFLTNKVVSKAITTNIRLSISAKKFVSVLVFEKRSANSKHTSSRHINVGEGAKFWSFERYVLLKVCALYGGPAACSPREF